MRRGLQLLVSLTVTTTAITYWAASARGEPLAPGVEHNAAMVGASRIDVVYVHPGAAVQIRAIVPYKLGGASPQDQCQALQPQGCIAAINADFFQPNGWPDGGMVSDGQVLKPPMASRPDRQQLSLNTAGQFITGASWPVDVAQSTGASYTLLASGQPQPIAVAPADDFHHMVYGNHPRTMLCWNSANGDKLLVTISGHGKDAGVSLSAATQIGQSVGATDCVNLDGGDSTMMALGNHRVSMLQGDQPRKVHNYWMVMGPPPPPKPAPPPPPPRPTTTTTLPPPTTTTVVTVPVTAPKLPAQTMVTETAAVAKPIGHGNSDQVLQVFATMLLMVATSGVSLHRRNRRQKEPPLKKFV